jgi:hypothetical protein
LEELVGKLKEWSGGRIAVVPESSCEAVALKQMLEKEAPNLRVQLARAIRLLRYYRFARGSLGIRRFPPARSGKDLSGAKGTSEVLLDQPVPVHAPLAASA